MKNTILLTCLLGGLRLFGQSSEEVDVKRTVDAFFESFHAQDSVGMKNVVTPEIILQTIGLDKEGKTILKTENFESLVKSIVAIPDSVLFQEKLTDYSINEDGIMAHVWTPYEFWLNGKLSHCGVNSFQLLKENGAWKIIYLIDTRKRDGCTHIPKKE
ncbi:3-methyl-2-oxobutanoate hydroxymethyltransferase [Maribacter thermophilus]|uniref:3-methyl-2-oxobutanoate hydroxymethyltransferase n=1 Tax=Maribacter thermophilus TaxID=1197874 RepID=UPI00069BA72A|nr:3-methyl-2-oxobutanoate hydroxymethyltransferase [Maribacter thermophilus]